MCVCVCVPNTGWIWMSRGNSWESVLAFHSVVPERWTPMWQQVPLATMWSHQPQSYPLKVLQFYSKSKCGGVESLQNIWYKFHASRKRLCGEKWGSEEAIAAEYEQSTIHMKNNTFKKLINKSNEFIFKYSIGKKISKPQPISCIKYDFSYSILTPIKVYKDSNNTPHYWNTNLCAEKKYGYI